MSVAVASSLHDEIRRARALTDQLFAQVLPEAFLERPIRERHRLIFYVGHLDAFDWNLIRRSMPELPPIESELDSLFAFGIDPAPGNVPEDRPRDWPQLPDVRRYVSELRQSIDVVSPQLSEKVLHMLLEHRLMHAETITYLLHNLPYSTRIMRMWKARPDSTSVPLEFIKIPAGATTLGLDRSTGFGWDNEFDAHTSDVSDFAISKYKVTNGQYLQFVEAGGPTPHYWTERLGVWRYRGFHGETPLPSDSPVYVSYNEAEAYARWSGKELPTEAQFHRAAFGANEEADREYPWGNQPPRREFGNFDFTNADLIPVTSDSPGDSAFGVSQLVGNGWEWTSTKFSPFEGFKPDPLYPGYSADFFDGEHHVVKGASCATDHMLLRRSFRNWFRDSYRYAYTSFRLVEN
jgi:formylglycine-generating enzyme required for sulfatase activity